MNRATDNERMIMDKQLIELAAKACGYEAEWFPGGTCDLVTKRSTGDVVRSRWDPVMNDGDRYRLAKKLGLVIDFVNNYIAYMSGGYMIAYDAGDEDMDIAIVRAAAEIGRAA